MTQAAKAQEPSMEEILASIRRIIADDDGKVPVAAKPAAPAPVPPARPIAPTPIPHAEPFVAESLDAEPVVGEAEILDLTEAMEVPAENPEETAAEGFRTIEPTQDLVFDEPAEEPAPLDVAEPEAIFPEPESQPVPIFPEPPSATLEAARHQFERDTIDDRSLLSPTTTAAVDTAFNSLAQTVLLQNSRTLDELVREMLRPMLKAWLDDNLPNMVERLVRAEIERVSRGRG